MSQNQVICGGQRSARKKQTQGILQENYSTAFLVVPTRQYAQKRSIELLDSIENSAIDGNSISDFTRFTQNLLKWQGIPVNLLEEWEQVLLIKSIILSKEGKERFQHYPGLLAPEKLANSFHRIIRNLKQAGITPEAFEKQIKKKAIEPWDEVVAWLYSAYQEQLIMHNGYDIPGLFWQAEIECQKDRPAYIADKKILIFDGFDDFTTSELRLIKALSSHFEQIVIGINLDPVPNRQDIYRLAKNALERLQSILDIKTVILETPPPKTSIEFIADTLFWRDEPQKFTPSTPTVIEIQRYINREEEIKEIARRIKQLIVQQKVNPQKIAVSYRQLNTVRPLIEKIFNDFGIPCHILSPQNLKDTYIGLFVERWLAQLSENSLSAITLILHDPLWNIPVSIRENFLLLLQTIGLSTNMTLEYIEKKITEKEETLNNFIEIEDENISTAEFQQFFDELKRWLLWRNKFQKRDRASNYVSFLLDLLNELKDTFQVLLDDRESEGKLKKEKEGYLQLLSVLKKLSLFFKNQELSLEEYQRLIFSLLADVPLFDPEYHCGVTCLDLPMIRNMEYDYLFIGGVEEGSIPLSPSSNVIYSDKDINALRQSGIPIDDVAKQIQREWLFFHQIFETAQKGVFLSHVLYSETHEERSASLLLREVQEVGQYIQDDVSIVLDKKSAQFCIPCSHAEFRNMLFYNQENQEILKKQYPDVYECGYSLQKREEGNESIYTGNLLSEDIQNWLSNKFGPNHVYSVNQIEEYIECPFRFWTQRILKLKDWEEELVYPSPLMMGSWVHDVLFILIKEHFDNLKKDRSSVINGTLRDVVKNVVEKDRRTYALQKKWVAITIEWLTNVLADFLYSDAALIGEDWKPSHFELAFGETKYQMADEKSQQEPFCMNINGKKVLFSGRIDRMDRHVEQPNLRIIDYKWGDTPKPSDMGVNRNQIQGKICSLQLMIYGLAVEDYLFKKENLSVKESCFLSIKEQKKTSAPWKTDKDLRETIKKIVENMIDNTIQNIHQGRFTPNPYKAQTCVYCFCRDACRYKKVEQGETSGEDESGEIETT